jgi:hypothetical protein
MKTLRSCASGVIVAALTLGIASSVGCAARERVVVRDRPEVVQPEVVHVETREPVVKEKVIVHP